LYGAYFDGKYVFPVSGYQTIEYDFTEQKLEIELDFDKEEYRPSEEVTLTIQTAAQSQVLISVVDESAIPNQWHNANFIRELYLSSRNYRWQSRSSQYASYTQHDFGGYDGGAEGGGGDDDYESDRFRDFFVDNPIFEIVKTDENGVGQLTFTLPDQITSWRVTAIGLTEDGFAGDTKENIISFLDFYCDLLYTHEYIAGDDIAALARVYGADEAEFTFNVLSQDEVIFTDTQQGRRVVFNAGKLPVGEYKVQLVAKSGELSDAVELPFTIVDSALIIQSYVSGVVSPDGDITLPELNMRDFPVRITLSNANIQPLTSILWAAACSQSSRTDNNAAAAYAQYFFTGEDSAYKVAHASDGGIPELIYENSDWYYTARFAAAFPEYVEREKIISYVRNGMVDSAGRAASTEKRAAGLLALAAVGEPVLLEIQELLSEARSTLRSGNYNVYLYLAAALVTIGDDSGAAEIISNLDANDVRLDMIETRDTLMFYINTALDPQAAWEYVRKAPQNKIVSDIAERVNFVRRIQLMDGTISEVEYTLDGVRHSLRLENDRIQQLHISAFSTLCVVCALSNYGNQYLHISKEQFDALDLVAVKGETEYSIEFYSSDGSNWNEADRNVSITREIEHENGMERITFTVTADRERTSFSSFVIYDRVPSNMRFMSARHPLGGRHAWTNVRHIQRQLVEIRFCLCSYCAYSRTVSYYANKLFDADMADGVAYVTNGRVWGHSWGRTGA